MVWTRQPGVAMGFYESRVLPKLIDVALGAQVEPTRARVAAGLHGHVLEVGFGSGRNVRHYPGSVQKVFAIEPAAGGRSLAAPRIAASRVPVEYIGLDGATVALDDESVDHVLITWSLCTIPDVRSALAEVHRVLRPGGTLRFVEHGRSPYAKAAKWQDRVTPVWKHVFGGCHLNRPIPDLITDAGLTMAEIRSYSEKGPETVGRMYEGVAVKSGAGAINA